MATQIGRQINVEMGGAAFWKLKIKEKRRAWSDLAIDSEQYTMGSFWTSQ
jgi:hypothetical protein